MTWGFADIKAAYDEGERQGASHMIVAWDSFDDSNYPIYVMPGENPRDKMPKNGDSVDECYRYSLGWESQSRERRARHFEYDPIPTPEPFVAKGSKVKIATRIDLTHGIVLPFEIPAYPSLNREARSGEVFVSIQDLENLSETDAFSSHVIGLSSEQEHALEATGWARKATRGGLYASEAFRERSDNTSILGEVINRFEPVWESEKSDRALAIWRALTDEERESIASLLGDIEYGKQAKA